MNAPPHLHHEELGKVLLKRLRMPYLTKHFNARYVWAIFVFINCVVTIAILSLLAFVSGSSFVFPSLGPTAILFFMTPRSEASRPRNALAGHAIGIICGYLGLLVAGLTAAPSVVAGGVTLPRVIAASLALGLTGAIMVAARTPHAPAGATTLIISLGFITQPFSLFIIELAVALLVIQAGLINRLAGARSKTHQLTHKKNQ